MICQNPAGAKITVADVFTAGSDSMKADDKLTFDSELRLVRTSW